MVLFESKILLSQGHQVDDLPNFFLFYQIK